MRNLQLREKGPSPHRKQSDLSWSSGPQKGYAEPATLPLGSLGAQDRVSRKGIKMLMEMQRFASQDLAPEDVAADRAPEPSTRC